MRMLPAIAAFIGLAFGSPGFTQDNPRDSSCGESYPTKWFFTNKYEFGPWYVSCRTYVNRESSWVARQVDMTLPPAPPRGEGEPHVETHVFRDYNGGRGMIDRGWSCAHDGSEFPLASIGSFQFRLRGCPDSKVEIPMRYQPFVRYTRPALETTAHCPEANSIVRTYECSSQTCESDSYRSGLWRGITRPLTPEQLGTYRFIGADASHTHLELYGCLYHSDELRDDLIMLAYSEPEPGKPSELLYRPANSPAFNQDIKGTIAQCFSSEGNVDDCPLTDR